MLYLNVFHLFFSMVHGDVIVDIVCLLDSSMFPVTIYDTILQNTSNNTLISQTMARADLITGTEAKQRYFTDSTIFRRFELIHITRAHSVIRAPANSAAISIGRLKLELIRAIAENVGICSIESIIDSTVSTSSDDMQWILNMPGLVAPIALGGWIITVVSCVMCWFCVCCTTDSKIATVVASETSVATAANVDPVVGVIAEPPPLPLVPPVQSTSKITRKPAGKGARSEMFPQIPTYTPTFNPQSPLTSSIDFQHQSSRYLELRIPSFKGPSTTTNTT